MSENEGWFVQHNFKVGDDLVNIRGVDVAHLRKNVEEYAEAVAEIAQLKANIAGGQALGGIVQPSNSAPVQQPAQQAPAPQQQAPSNPWGGSPAPQGGGLQNGTPHPEGITCPMCNSVVKYKAFTSKAGKDFKLWACPNQRSKGDGHYSQFI